MYASNQTNFVDFLQGYTSGTQKVVKNPLIDSIYLNILQVLKLKFAKINERGSQIRSGGGKISKMFKEEGGDIY